MIPRMLVDLPTIAAIVAAEGATVAWVIHVLLRIEHRLTRMETMLQDHLREK